MKRLPIPGQVTARAPQRAKPSTGGVAVEHGLEAFWAELLESVGPHFSGSVVLHCAGGEVKKYEVHTIGRPRGGAVSVQ
jgi:hypothetical protein